MINALEAMIEGRFPPPEGEVSRPPRPLGMPVLGKVRCYPGLGAITAVQASQSGLRPQPPAPRRVRHSRFFSFIGLE